MAYEQANIVLCARYMTPKEDLFDRARTFQDSLETEYRQDHPSRDGTLHPRNGSSSFPSTTRRCWDGRSQWSCEAKGARSIELPPSVSSSDYGRGNGDVRPLHEPSTAREADGADGEGATGANPPPPPPHLEVASPRTKKGRAAKQ